MQLTNPAPDGRMSSQMGNFDIAGQLQQQQSYHRRILLERKIKSLWSPILLVVIGVLIAAGAGLLVGILGQNNFTQVALKGAVIAVGLFGASILFFIAARRIEWGIVLTAIITTAFLPQLFSIKSLAVFPVLPLLFFLFIVMIVQAAFRVRTFIFPSFWAIWPLFGFILMAIISNIFAQFLWTPGVPRRMSSSPIIYDELLAIGLCFIPLIAVTFTCMALSNKERYVEYIQRTFLILAALGAAVVIIEFKRIGATVYTFRYSEPSIFWMKLKDLAQLINLGCMIAYSRFLYAKRWRDRLRYLVIVAMCLAGVYLTLENSWWIEIAVGLIVMTAVYSRRLLVFFMICALPLIPVIKNELAKISTVKTADYYRLIIWQDAIRLWRKQPILGVGPGNFYVYDQHFTQLPRNLRDFSKTGLGVAHNGYLQVLGEMGPIGIFFWVSILTVIAIISYNLYRRSPVLKQKSKAFVRLLGLELSVDSENRADRMLGLVGLGLVVGSALADFFSGGFIVPARQIDSLQWIPHTLTSWFLWGCVMYRDQLWRMARKGLKIEKSPTTGRLTLMSFAPRKVNAR